jgi:hypothetical protein
MPQSETGEKFYGLSEFVSFVESARYPHKDTPVKITLNRLAFGTGCALSLVLVGALELKVTRSSLICEGDQPAEFQSGAK